MILDGPYIPPLTPDWRTTSLAGWTNSGMWSVQWVALAVGVVLLSICLVVDRHIWCGRSTGMGSRSEVVGCGCGLCKKLTVGQSGRGTGGVAGSEAFGVVGAEGVAIRECDGG